jgi:hypothetical protein
MKKGSADSIENKNPPGREFRGGFGQLETLKASLRASAVLRS